MKSTLGPTKRQKGRNVIPFPNRKLLIASLSAPRGGHRPDLTGFRRTSASALSQPQFIFCKLYSPHFYVRSTYERRSNVAPLVPSLDIDVGYRRTGTMPILSLNRKAGREIQAGLGNAVYRRR